MVVVALFGAQDRGSHCEWFPSSQECLLFAQNTSRRSASKYDAPELGATTAPASCTSVGRPAEVVAGARLGGPSKCSQREFAPAHHSVSIVQCLIFILDFYSGH